MALVLVFALGAGKVWSDRQEEKARFASASESMQSALKAYEDDPTMESAIYISSVLDGYVGDDKGKGGDILDALKDKLSSFCQDDACAYHKKIHDQIDAEERNIKELKSELDSKGVEKLLLMCKRIFEKQGDELLVDCYDTGIRMQRFVLLVDEGFASKMKFGFPFYAHVKSVGVRYVNLYNGSKEYFQFYRNINIDWESVKKSESTVDKLKTSLGSGWSDINVLTARSWREVEKNIEPELKAAAAMFGNNYMGYEKRVERAKGPDAPLTTHSYTFRMDERRVSNHVLAGMKIVIDSRDLSSAESDPLSMIAVDGKVVAQSEATIFFEDGIVSNSGAVLMYDISVGGNSCDASTRKAVVIMPNKETKVSPDLGWCDTTYSLNGDELKTESKEAGTVCNIRVDTGEMNCRKSTPG